LKNRIWLELKTYFSNALSDDKTCYIIKINKVL
jgi:hypothetical protein